MPSKATTVKEFLASLPEDRRKAIDAVRKVMKKNLDKGFQEGMQYGGIGFYVPHSIFPGGYHCDPKQPLPFAGLMSQKNHMSISMFCLYMDPKGQEGMAKAWKKAGKKLDMGKACIRFKKLEDVPLDVLGDTIRRIKLKDFVATYEGMFGAKKKPASKKAAAKKKPAAKKKTAKKSVTKKSTAKKKPAAKKAVKKKAASKKPVTKKKAVKKTGAKR